MDEDQTPYGMRPDDQSGQSGKSRLEGLRDFANSDQRTFKQMWSEQPKMNIWERFCCCCGCILIVPVPLAILGMFL